MENLFDFAKFSEQLTTMLTSYAPKVVGALLTLIIGFWIAGRLTKVVKNYCQV
ncbi:MAG: hypothetical protein HC912_11300, partial [Saprospiraceae bacterium]|nr:hypothetical protein [Saprospiraceae bacterium]